MNRPKTGCTPLRLTTLVVSGIAFIVHIAAVAYPVWDQINATWKPNPMMPVGLKIQASGSLWDFNVTIDQTLSFFPPNRNLMNTVQSEWKEPIRMMALSAIGVGAISIMFFIISALIDRCVQNYVILLLIRMLPIAALYCTSLEVTSGALLYKYQYTKTASYEAFDLNRAYPIDKFVLGIGWHLECAAGALFNLASLVAISGSIHNNISSYEKNPSSVVPFEEGSNSEDGKNSEKRQ
ncbi:uncharacterized protein LOC134254266 [Saccostrea cucullata]|uniref:uncharacterized protein LOC134254266 n=1 Tax=Saccostrea cuccullata TaxID=36930 RepID=UPI002ECFDF3E